MTAVRADNAIKCTMKAGEVSHTKIHDWQPGMNGLEVDDVMKRIQADQSLLKAFGVEVEVHVEAGSYDDDLRFVPAATS